MYKLKIETLKKGTIELAFENIEQIALILGIQTGVFFGYVNEDDLDLFLHVLSDNLSKRFQERERLGVFDNLDENSVIVDIGAGTGWLNIVMYKYFGGKHYLVDKNEWTTGYAQTQWSPEYGYYNDWSVFYHLADCNWVNLDDFILIAPEDEWPEEVDLIQSAFSYMWHYPRSTYWDRIKKYDTNLCFDILNNENNLEDISKELGKEAVYNPKPGMLFHWFMKDINLESGSPGKCCYWRK